MDGTAYGLDSKSELFVVQVQIRNKLLFCPQIFFQFKYLIPDPIANDVKYQASAQPFLVFGLLTTALAIGHVNHMA